MKKIICAFLLVITAVSLVACGQSQQPVEETYAVDKQTQDDVTGKLDSLYSSNVETAPVEQATEQSR